MNPPLSERGRNAQVDDAGVRCPNCKTAIAICNWLWANGAEPRAGPHIRGVFKPGVCKGCDGP